MIIIDDVVVGTLVGVAAVGVRIAVSWAINKWKVSRLREKASEYLKTAPLTEADNEIIAKLREVMAEEFPEGIERRLKGMSLEDRQKLYKGLVEECAKIYGVEVTEVNFLTSDQIGPYCMGFFSQTTGGITFNLDGIANQDPDVMRSMIDTIFHELRHAQQYRAITDSAYNFGSEEQQHLWALNFTAYIDSSVDFALYQQQAVEADARIFAEQVMQNF